MALSRDHMVTTAVEILRAYGLADLSMRRLARELQVQPGALYWHVSSKQELLVEVAAALLSEVPLPSPDLPAPEALASLASAVRSVIVTVPDGAEVVATAYAAEPASVAPLRELGRLVARAGVPDESRAAVTDLVVNHLLGSVAVEQTERALSAGADDHALPSPAERAKAFEVGLGVILRGMMD